MSRDTYLNNIVPLFLTAPTWESDGIVLEWVQGQDIKMRAKFYVRARKLLAPEKFYSDISFLVGQVLMNYKPGTYAKALLAIGESDG